MRAVRTILFTILLSVGILLLLLAAFLWLPTTPNFVAHPQPAQSYDEALARFADVQARDTDGVFPECQSTLLTHGRPMSRTLVILHGITNCPAQAMALGQQFYDLGYNVLMPRLPHHGLADPMTTDIADLTAEQLVTAADEAADIAAGLGQEVTVAGFSTGGTMAAWIAQQRPGVERTVLLSPFLSPKTYPAWLVHPIMRALLLMPNQFWWWDKALQDEAPGPRYAYDRYPTHAVAQVMRLSFAVRRQARQRAPQSQTIVVITNAGPQETVDNAVTAALVADWRRWEQVTISTCDLASTLDLKHNYMDPNAFGQPLDVVQVVHPLLIAQIDRNPMETRGDLCTPQREPQQEAQQESQQESQQEDSR